MVRNTPSSQTLRTEPDESLALSGGGPNQRDALSLRPKDIPELSDKADTSKSAGVNPLASSSSLRDLSRQPAQVVGKDDFTKGLMTRVATGVASEKEMAQFQTHINRIASRDVKHRSAPRGVIPGPASHDVRPGSVEKDAQPVLQDGWKWRMKTLADAAGQPSTQQDWSELDGRQAHDLLQLEKLLSAIDYPKGSARRNGQSEQAPPALKHERPVADATFEEGAKQAAPVAIPKAAPRAARFEPATRVNAEKYTKPFCDFMTANPTVFHAVDAIKEQLQAKGWKQISERDAWDIEPSGKYFLERNGSSLVAFVVGKKYKPGNGAAIIAAHVDALTAKLKPVSQVPNKAGFLQLGVAPYAGGLNSTWWDRDLGIGGRVLVKEGDKIVTKLVKLGWPIARIPTLAPHFGAAAVGPFNPETQMTPIIGLDDTQSSASATQAAKPFSQPSLLGGGESPVGSFVSTQPPKLVRAIGKELGLSSSQLTSIVNWELELFDVQPATVGGMDKEFIFAGRIDDKMCSWAAIQALVDGAETDTADSSLIKMVGLFDDEEIGSLLRQGAHGNLLPTTVERAVGALADHKPTSDLLGRTYANSFLVSADVTHAVNPNFLGAYLEHHAPHLNVGLTVSADSNGHMTTDAVSTAVLKGCADRVGARLQVFQIRNDSRSGGTVGPMLSAATGMRSVDAGIPQLSMHSIRATTGSLDPGLGLLTFKAFLNGFEEVDEQFRA